MKWNWKIPNTMIAIGLVIFVICVFCNKITEYLIACVTILSFAVSVICFALPSVMEKCKDSRIWMNTKTVSMWSYPIGVITMILAIAIPIAIFGI